ncbi:Aprataxin-like protein [Cytospora mali]|uniref:Aprataxin-like protein n=1 Tax=Cytospora mali TaxID=578113 RepID=A0A194UYL8_CYTMA|nr:Aprataxin-like protein [Valsa mali var. pyri (nom. inval.)]
MGADSPSSRPKRSPSDTPDAPNKKRPPVGDEDSSNDTAEDAITKEEIDGAEPSAASSGGAPRARNAFSELMASKPQPKIKPKVPSTTSTTYFGGREGLGAYLANPESFPASRVIFHTPGFVAIHDLFPKATVHCLLLPRSQAKTRLHPFEAFDDEEFLASVRREAERLKDLVAKELQRLLGKYSAAEAARNAVLDGDAEPDRDEEGNVVLPEGRDWGREVKVGVHARPSMNHLHVHVMSRDMHSEKMKHRKHYNSFTTVFFVPLEDFPLAENDPRRRQSGWPERPMVCWRCKEGFGNKFKLLKDHLEGEFEAWKRE